MCLPSMIWAFTYSRISVMWTAFMAPTVPTGMNIGGLYHSVVGGDESRSGRRYRIGCLKLEFHFNI